MYMYIYTYQSPSTSCEDRTSYSPSTTLQYQTPHVLQTAPPNEMSEIMCSIIKTL